MLLFQVREAHSRPLAKAMSWRILGSIDTFLPSWLFTRLTMAAVAIAITEMLTRVVLYYFYERACSTVPWGMWADLIPHVAIAPDDAAQ